MAGIYIYSDESSVAGELVGFAKGAGKEAFALAFKPEEAEKLAGFGADKVLLISGDSPIAESYSRSLAAYLSSVQAELLLLGMSPRDREFAAKTAGYLRCGMVSDALSLAAVEGGFKTEKMLYGGISLVTETLQDLSVVTISSGKFESLAASALAEIVPLELEADTRIKLVASAPIIKEGVDLNAAERVVGVGLGFNKQEDLKLAEDLATALDAEIGCTRSLAEERKWLPVEQYIGISGAVIKPQLYLSMGISGQIQHIIGVRDARIIVGIDTNENAPIFKAADFGIVGDMYEIVPLLTEALSS